MYTCISSHGLKRSWRSCPRRVNAGNKNTPIMHHPRRRNVTTLMVGLKNRSHTQKSHPKVVNPRDIAGERKKKQRTDDFHNCWSHKMWLDSFFVMIGIYKDGDEPEPKRWKANFRCALHSLPDVKELTSPTDRKGRNASRTYRFLQPHEVQPPVKRKQRYSIQIRMCFSFYFS